VRYDAPAQVPVDEHFPCFMNTNELWQSALGELELKLSKANFTTWFKNTFIASFENGQINVAVPNTFTKAWLEKKYHRDILNSLQTITANGVRTIIYRVETRQPSPIHVRMPNEPLEPEPFVDEQPFRTEEAAQTSSGERTTGDLTLNPRYNFTNFVVGKTNELAHAASQAVATQPGTTYNPLFIYGGVGLGKTHLLQAIGNELLRRNKTTRIMYVTCERFTNEFIDAIRTGKGHEFKDCYRNVDLLLIDDIQFITSKERTQEEFFHTFNALHQRNKQIVLSSDRPPKAIPGLENRLLSRFESGMMADVGTPDLETRVAILEAKCKERTYFLEKDILHHIAGAIQSNIRELEGALTKIIAYHQFKNVQPSLETIASLLTSFQPTQLKKTITPRQLIQAVASYYDLQIPDLLGKSREKRLALPRQIVMFIMREEMKTSYPSIGNELGGRDHTTAMHAYGKIQTNLKSDEKLQRDVELIKQRLMAI